ncbi:unnamed protein product [Aspergillus oryzae]|uniref:Unnamed protein product n=2 Tax=Aspergillus oryzae TaxID=5062 RepID=A0AAN5BVC6_ASPOZ|nr:unnamed protein product [Aspergillus oryzae]GMF84633.1 unnamed protein product [Aspergillus oryzae]GMG11499.1 unnamed protein product [Aspergillus oryzae]GMG26815.1 unnamed protein product [Aspergillus oryzae]GMG47329.1 unnamed protein product [Aspergillus oryzae var. brunneus]
MLARSGPPAMWPTEFVTVTPVFARPKWRGSTIAVRRLWAVTAKANPIDEKIWPRIRTPGEAARKIINDPRARHKPLIKVMYLSDCAWRLLHILVNSRLRAGMSVARTTRFIPERREMRYEAYIALLALA